MDFDRKKMNKKIARASPVLSAEVRLEQRYENNGASNGNRKRSRRVSLYSYRATWSIPRSWGLPIYLVRNEGSIRSETALEPQKARE